MNSPFTVLDPPCADDETAIGRIREALVRVRFDEPSIGELLGSAAIPADRELAANLPHYLHRTRDDSPLAALVKVLVLGQSAPEPQIRAAIAPNSLEDWTAVGLLNLRDGRVAANFELRPCQNLLLATDWPASSASDGRQVMRIAGSSRTLAQLAIRRQSNRTLDLGTGCGVLAMLAATHSDQVVAVDINPRAVAMCRFNARLNDVANVHAREGDRFDPVAGESFDLVLCNPPFLIAPASDVVHSHNPFDLDAFCESIVRAVPRFLNLDGYCQLIGNWACIAGEDWRLRLSRWCENSGCDAWVLHSHTEDAADYARRRLCELAPDGRLPAAEHRDWLAYYERHRVEGIAFGLITLRRSSRSRHWLRFDDFPAIEGDCGWAIEQGFDRRDFLEDHADDAALLTARVKSVAGLRWRQEHELASAGWQSAHTRVRIPSGLCFAGQVDPVVAGFLAECRDGLKLGVALRRQAAAARQSVESLQPAFVQVVRRLIELGFLVPV